MEGREGGGCWEVKFEAGVLEEVAVPVGKLRDGWDEIWAEKVEEGARGGWEEVLEPVERARFVPASPTPPPSFPRPSKTGARGGLPWVVLGGLACGGLDVLGGAELLSNTGGPIPTPQLLAATYKGLVEVPGEEGEAGEAGERPGETQGAGSVMVGGRECGKPCFASTPPTLPPLLPPHPLQSTPLPAPVLPATILPDSALPLPAASCGGSGEVTGEAVVDGGLEVEGLDTKWTAEAGRATRDMAGGRVGRKRLNGLLFTSTVPASGPAQARRK